MFSIFPPSFSWFNGLLLLKNEMIFLRFRYHQWSAKTTSSRVYMKDFIHNQRLLYMVADWQLDCPLHLSALFSDRVLHLICNCNSNHVRTSIVVYINMLMSLHGEIMKGMYIY